MCPKTSASGFPAVKRLHPSIPHPTIDLRQSHPLHTFTPPDGVAGDSRNGIRQSSQEFQAPRGVGEGRERSRCWYVQLPPHPAMTLSEPPGWLFLDADQLFRRRGLLIRSRGSRRSSHVELEWYHSRTSSCTIPLRPLRSYDELITHLIVYRACTRTASTL